MSDQRAEREALRRSLRDRRAALLPVEVRAASAAVCQHLAALPAFAAAPLIALYAATRNEIDPAALFGLARARGAEVAYPRVDRTDPPLLAFHLVEDPGKLEPGRFGIAAPSNSAPPAARDRIALICVPGLAFAEDGHRLGYGSGYYDAELALAPAALRVGLCHSFQLVPALPRREGDEPVDVIVTPDGARATGARFQPAKTQGAIR